MYTCEIHKEDTQYRFECLDYRGFTVFSSVVFESRDKTLTELYRYLNSSQDYVYETCEGENCHYFKIVFDGIVLLESRSFNDKAAAYDFVEQLKGGCIVSHVIDKSFEDGIVYYYLSCTSIHQFKKPLRITLEKEDNQFVASVPELNIFAYSSDLSEAIEEIKVDLDDLFEDLFTKKHNLSKRAESIKAVFKSKLDLSGVS